MQPLRPKHTRVAPNLECVGHLSQKCSEVIAAEQVMEVGDTPEVRVTGLIERIGKVHHEIAEASCPNAGAQSREGAPCSVEPQQRRTCSHLQSSVI